VLKYIRVLWKHDFPDDPTDLYYEVRPDRSVPRMVEVFTNGHAEADTVEWHARRYPTFCGASLVDGEMSTAAEIRARASDEFTILEITQTEFERAFQNATPLTDPKVETP
jgi:hypothetical protein